MKKAVSTTAALSVVCVLRASAAVEADLDLRRYPFDRHRLDATFEVLGADSTEVVLQAESEADRFSYDGVRTPQWRLVEVRQSTGELSSPHAGRTDVAPTFVVSMDVERESFFVVRLVVIPITYFGLIAVMTMVTFTFL